jgi:uncharacterized damage-inducible protein DinB
MQALREAQLTRLVTQLGSLEVLLAGMDPGAISRRPPSGKWSARENLAHLGRYHEVFLIRVDRILAEAAPRFSRYRAEEDAEWPQWQSLPIEDVLQRLAALRGQLVQRIREIRSENFSKIGVHPAFGSMSLTEWLEFFLVHEAHHLYVVLQRVRERAGPVS